MEAPVEICYAGVVVGRAQEVRSTEGETLAFFLALREPMPVGTVVSLRSGGQETPARVVRAVEAADAVGSGMQVRLIGDAEVAAPEWIPPPAKAKAVTPAPPSEPSSVEPGPANTQESNAEGSTPSAPEPTSQPAVTSAAEPATDPVVAATVVAPAPVDPTPVAGAEASAEASVEKAAEAFAETAAEAFAEKAASQTNAVPESVPVAVGSSMTGALENATETTRPYGQSTSTFAAAPSSAPSQVATDWPSGETGSGALSGGTATAEELPPARPVSGPSGRRKTRRRK